MSLLETGKVLHKTGKELPVVPDQDQRAMYADAMMKSLRQALAALGMSTKTVMGWTSAGERTVKVWIAATNGARGEALGGPDPVIGPGVQSDNWLGWLSDLTR